MRTPTRRRPSFFGVVLLLTAAAGVSAAVGMLVLPGSRGTATAEVTAAEPYLCYDVNPSKDAKPFKSIPNVRIVDIFEDEVFTLQQPRQLCNPASEGDAVPTDPDHFNRYQITSTNKSPKRIAPKGVVFE